MAAMGLALALWLLASAGAQTTAPQTAAPQAPVEIDPALAAAVERFFATQEAEDVEGYLALWSASARRPQLESLKHVFDSGDDRYSEIRIAAVTPIEDRVRVRVSARRQRTLPPRAAGFPPVVFHTRMDISLTYVREGGDWKLLSERPAIDELADALIAAETADEREALLTADADLLTEQLLLGFSRRAGEAAQQGRYADAERGYERMLEVARRMKHRRYEGEALQNLANTYYYQRKHAAALDLYEQRLALERERGDEEAVASALSGIATIRYALAEYGAALTAYREVLGIQERLGNNVSAATALVSIGNVLYVLGDFTGAIEHYQRGLDLHRASQYTAGEAAALQGLGRVYLAQGDYARALEAFAGVLEEGRARNDSSLQGNAMLSIGDAHVRLGNIDVARATFEQSRDHYAAISDLANVGRTWQGIALTELLAGRLQQAEDGYTKSREFCSQAKFDECVASAEAGLGFAHTAQEEFADAVDAYGRAIKAFAALGQREHMARAQLGLSQALLGKGDYGDALRVAGDARHIGIGLGSDELVWRALVAEARALRRLGRSRDARGAAGAAVAALDQQLERSRRRPADPVPRDSGAVFATLAILQAEDGDAAAAFETSERLRIHDMRLGLARVEREIARGMTAAERDEEQALAAELVTLHAQLDRERTLPKPDAARIADLERRVDAAARRRSAHEAALFDRLPELRLWRGLIPPATRYDLESVVASPGTVALSFVVDDDDLLVLAASGGEAGVEVQAFVQPAARRKIAELVAALTPAAVLRDAAEWRKVAVAFLDQWPAPVRELLAASSRIVVLPHDFLWRVPFDALPVGGSAAATRTEVRYAHSITALVKRPPRRQHDRDAAKDPRLLVAAAPDLHESARTGLAQVAPGWTLRDEAIASAELDALREALQGQVRVLTGPDATEAALREQLPGADVIHLGLPFRINGAGALFSPMLLAGGAEDDPVDRADDGSLDPREVINLDLTADLAVLSDGAAMSMREAADDVAVVRWAWRAAGVESILVARWDADPAASRALLQAFHARVRAGASAAAALREAQRVVREKPEWSTPFYWAGWVLMSDW